jgi:hypothetical protein
MENTCQHLKFAYAGRPYFVKPAFDIGETFAGGDVIDDDDAVCAAVVGGRDGPEPLLACKKGEYFSRKQSYGSGTLQERWIRIWKIIITYPAVFRIRDILVRIRIHGSVPLSNGSESGSCSFRQ